MTALEFMSVTAYDCSSAALHEYLHSVSAVDDMQVVVVVGALRNDFKDLPGGKPEVRTPWFEVERKHSVSSVLEFGWRNEHEQPNAGESEQEFSVIMATFTGPRRKSLFPKAARPAVPCATYCYHAIHGSTVGHQ